ncbi:MAG TPA: TetR family transcriptional regulator C-terminal domain-containing protein [Bryobacteraceae bacterium]|nr:TetR family transcriptional regulator C-terminal domain-containing protein [Bryobacteraceae bacterium]
MRADAKSRSRLQIIEATIEAIHRFGFAGTTVTRILEIAGLSRGMIHLHFTSKERLMVAVAKHLSEDYTAHWNQAMRAAGPAPEQQLRALLAADFDASVLNERNMAVWIAFRGEAHAVPDFMPYLDSRESRLRRALLSACAALCANGAYPGVKPKLAVNAFMALLEGMWIDFHLYPKRFDRATAKAVCMQVAAAMFPRHISSR